MKICVLGPIYPYRGGIAHYTTLMSKALVKRHEVTVLSYRMQYPRLLYRRGPQKDMSNPEMAIPGTEFILNTASPFSWAETARRINRDHPDLLILPWWHPYFAPCYWGMIRKLRRDIRIIFICHNVLPHESLPFQRAITKMVLAKGNGYIVHTTQEEEQIRDILNGTELHLRRTPHPTYDFFNKNRLSKAEARKLLSLRNDDLVLLFFGFIREYKGVKTLLEAFSDIHGRTGAKLLVVGEFSPNDKEDYMNRIRSVDRDEGNIIVVDDYVPDDEVEKYFVSCDVVVLPYLSATQSGIVQIAYGFEKPVIATKVGGLPEVVIDNETGYIVPPGDPGAISDAVFRLFKDKDKDRYASAIKREQYKYSWDKLVDTVEEMMQV